MLQQVADSDMRMSTLRDLVLYPIFKEGGLWDQENAFQKEEQVTIRNYIIKYKLWEMNIPLEGGCSINSTDVNGCPKFKKWVSGRGVSMDAMDMRNFMLNETSAVAEFDNNLAELKAFEDAMKAKEKEAETYYPAILKAFEDGTDIFKKDTGNEDMKPVRIL